MIQLTMMLFMALFFLGCSAPKVEVYGKPGAGNQNRAPSELSAFAASVSTPAKNVCASCHAWTPIEGQNLSPNSDSQNRLALLAYIKARSAGSCDATVLYNKISGYHGGGNQSRVMPQSLIKQWIDNDKSCAGSATF
jgi:hypothetical protein